jgi:hypothetical protein
MIRFVNTSGTLQSSNRRLFSMLDTTTIFTSHISMIFPSLMSVCLRHQARKQTETIKRELLKLYRVNSIL